MVPPVAEVSVGADGQGDGLQHLTAEVPGQALQRRQVLELQVIQWDVAVLHRTLLELLEELLEDAADAHARQQIALLDVAVQRLGDEALVTDEGGEEM